MIGARLEESIDRRNGRLLSVVTYLESWTPPSGPPPAPPRPDARVERRPRPDLDEYLRLFRRIGDPWLWYARLVGGREGVARRIRAAGYELWWLRVGDTDQGLCELDRSCPGEVAIVYCGLAPECIGRGLGGFLLRSILHEAWTEDVQRVWLHTCTEDHPGAADFYRHLGFRDFAKEAEWVPDPRLRGLLPRDAGAHVPLAE